MQIKKINGEEKIRMESKLIIDVPDEETGERIDSFLSGKTDFTRTRIQQLIKERNIMVNLHIKSKKMMKLQLKFLKLKQRKLNLKI